MTVSNVVGPLTGLSSIANGSITGSMLAGTVGVRVIGITIDGSGSAPVAGSKGYVTVPFTGTIAKWYLVSDISGSCIIDVKRSASSIVGAGNLPTLSSTQSGNAAPASWTSVAITKGDIIEFNLNSATTLTRVNLVLEVTVS